MSYLKTQSVWVVLMCKLIGWLMCPRSLIPVTNPEFWKRHTILPQCTNHRLVIIAKATGISLLERPSKTGWATNHFRDKNCVKAKQLLSSHIGWWYKLLWQKSANVKRVLKTDTNIPSADKNLSSNKEPNKLCVVIFHDSLSYLTRFTCEWKFFSVLHLAWFRAWSILNFPDFTKLMRLSCISLLSCKTQKHKHDINKTSLYVNYKLTTVQMRKLVWLNLIQYPLYTSRVIVCIALFSFSNNKKRLLYMQFCRLFHFMKSCFKTLQRCKKCNCMTINLN